jgi:hypothetical protein
VFRFTVVNNTASGVGVTERAGTAKSTYTLTRADTMASWQARKWTTTGGVKPTLTAGGTSVTIADGAAYELYRRADGALAIRRLS